MIIALAAAFSICATPAPPPPTTTATPLKTIEIVTASPLCSILHKNIGQSLSGLMANDNILTLGTIMMREIAVDGANQPLSISPTGGAGAASEMDDMQLSQIVAQFATNIERIDALLADPRAFTASPKTESQLALAETKEKLEAVVAEQRRALNILASTVYSNEANDLQSRCDPVSGCPRNAAPVRFSPRQAFATQLLQEQKVEAQVSPAVFKVVRFCRKPR